MPLLPACRRKSWSPGSASQWLCSLLPLAVSCGLLSARLESRDARRLATLSIGIFDVVQQRETRKASAQSHEADGSHRRLVLVKVEERGKEEEEE